MFLRFLIGICFVHSAPNETPSFIISRKMNLFLGGFCRALTQRMGISKSLAKDFLDRLVLEGLFVKVRTYDVHNTSHRLRASQKMVVSSKTNRRRQCGVPRASLGNIISPMPENKHVPMLTE